MTAFNRPCIPGPGRAAPLLQLPPALTLTGPPQGDKPQSPSQSERVTTLEESMRQVERGIQSGTLCFHFEVFKIQVEAKRWMGVLKFVPLSYLWAVKEPCVVYGRAVGPNLHPDWVPDRSPCGWFLLVCVFVCMCVFCVPVIYRIYTEGSLVCLKTVLISQRTWTRIDIRMFYHVSNVAYSDYAFYMHLVTLSPLAHPSPHLMKFNWLSLSCADSYVVTLTSRCAALLSDDATRVVLQGQEDYVNASRITVNIAALKLCLMSLFDIQCKLIPCLVCARVCLSLRWRPQCLVYVCIMLQLRVPCHRPALTFGRLSGSNRHTPSSCLQL